MDNLPAELDSALDGDTSLDADTPLGASELSEKEPACWPIVLVVLPSLCLLACAVWVFASVAYGVDGPDKL